MDWIDEKLENIRKKLKNVSLKKALMAYVLVFTVLALVLTWMTKMLCGRWMDLVYQNYASYSSSTVTFYNAIAEMNEKDSFVILVLQMANNYCIILYSIVSMFLASMSVYRTKLKTPLLILENGTKEIGGNNLDFSLSYDSTDELGLLCKSFEEMRIGLVQEKEAMWGLLEEKKRVNAAFAHDLRTPLTVLRGYTDVLTRYIPEQKISEEKLVHTLNTMSGQIVRLESFCNTMKNIHSLEEVPLERVAVKFTKIYDKINEICEMLNLAGGVNLVCLKDFAEEAEGEIDTQIVLEVFENLMSNAIRYACYTVTITVSQKEKGLLLYVQDDGTGFDEEALKNAAKAYYGKERTNDHFGIGLYISSILCKRHDGRLDIANSISGGALISAEFCFSSVNLNNQ